MIPPAQEDWVGEDAWASICVQHAGREKGQCDAHVEFYDPHEPPTLARLEPRLLPLERLPLNLLPLK